MKTPIEKILICLEKSRKPLTMAQCQTLLGATPITDIHIKALLKVGLISQVGYHIIETPTGRHKIPTYTAKTP